MPHSHPPPTKRQPSARHTPQRPALTPYQSKYLSPVQHARIESWRITASTITSPVSSPTSPTPQSLDTSSTPTKAKIKSAPASLDIHPPGHTSPGYARGHTHLNLTMTPASSHSPCVTCAARSVCSCSTSSPRVKGYYSNKKKKTNTTATSGQVPATPATGSAGMPPLANGDKRGLPTPEQVRAYAMGQAPSVQYGQVGVGMLPSPIEVAVPKDPARIAGVRDPISQN